MAWFKYRCPICDADYDYDDDTGCRYSWELKEKVDRREIDIRCTGGGHWISGNDIY